MRAAGLLLLALASAAGAEAPINLPLLPVHARLDAGGGSSFCASEELKRGLAGWAFSNVFRSGEYSPTTDLVVACAPYDEGRVQFSVKDRDGADVESFRSKVTGAQFEGIAFLVARRLAESRKTIEAALVAHRADLRATAAQGGAQAIADGDWAAAARSLYLALESNAEPAPLYFGLYMAHAKLGHVLQARWYLLVFCEAVGKRPDQLNDAQLAPLREMTRARGDDGFAAASMAGWRRLIAEGKGADAMFLLKDILERAPWTVAGYDAMADAYGKLRWGPLEDGWRQRAKTARRAASRRRNHESLLNIVDPE